ncbi:MAG: penicillin-binding transpeptidase domain-containing protein [Oscillospiraceae bacterium]|nr:penicillin-binding transpeptidase domain-containing protein [Oscillospiraceae bacterium]
MSLFMAAVVAMGFIAMNFANLQIAEGKRYEQEILRQITKSRDVRPVRGDILDRNGKRLAYSVSVNDIAIDPKALGASLKSLGISGFDFALEFSMITGIGWERVFDRLDRDGEYEMVARQVDRELGGDLRRWADEAGIYGIIIEDSPKRVYPYGNLASHVIGFTGDDGRGLAGIETIMEDRLRGTVGKTVYGVDGNTRKLPFAEEVYVEAVDGYGVVLTIDEAIQTFAENALDDAIRTHRLLNGAVAIVMDPNSGEILAMSSKPDYDCNDPRRMPDLPYLAAAGWTGRSKEDVEFLEANVWRNKAVSATYEPGSTFKAITAAMALEERVVTPDTPLDDYPVEVADYVINCWRTELHGHVTFRESVYYSCNPAFVTVSRSLGIKRFYEYMRAFGFLERTGVGLLGEEKGVIHQSPQEIDMATASFGQSFTITPLQLITAYCTLANGGHLVRPTIIKELLDSKGNVVERYEAEVVRNVISEETSSVIRGILEGVVSTGTGRNSYIPGYRVAGKTGTSETVESRLEVSDRKIASFSSFAPADDPVICVLVILDHPTGPFGHNGGTIAAPVARQIMEETLEYLEVERRYTDEDLKRMVEESAIPNVKGMNVSEALGTLRDYGFNYRLEGGGGDDRAVFGQWPAAGTTLPRNSIVVVYSSEESLAANGKAAMPNVLGKTIYEATEALNAVGLNVKVEGFYDSYVAAVRQQYEPGEMVDKGSVVKVEFISYDTE